MPTLRQLFLSHMAQTSPSPLQLEIEKADGIYLYDVKGKQYMDVIAGIGVSGLGHRHPRVVEAIRHQCEHYLHTMVYGEYVLSPQVQLAKLLCSQLPASLNNVYFVNSGSEATEGAMKLAKRYTGRHELISCFNAYHGSTQGAASLMSDPFFTQAYRPLLPGIQHIDFNNDEHLERITEKTAGVIVEPVQAEWGVRTPARDYLKKLKKRCDETGALLIFDEAQTGFGRTGSLFAFQRYGVKPDILLLAKGMGGGMPIGAFVAAQHIMQVFSHEPVLGHITTFGGHPVSCAAALATLQVLLEEELISKVGEKEKQFRALLLHPRILEVRSAGLLMAVELESAAIVHQVIEKCLENGLVTDWFLFNDRCLRLAPPLIITTSEIERACAILLAALDAV